MSSRVWMGITTVLVIVSLGLLGTWLKTDGEKKVLMKENSELHRTKVKLETELKTLSADLERALKNNSLFKAVFIHEGAAEMEKPISAAEIEIIKQRAADFDIEPVKKTDKAVIITNKGSMKLELYPDEAQNHCNNFKKLANSGFYDGTTFHRVIPGFMIQGGDILSRDESRSNDGTGSPGWNVDAEFNDIKHVEGVLSMARSRDPNSAGSQFFICAAAAEHLDRSYTAFGKVIVNKDVIQKIVNVPRDSSDNPLEPVRIIAIRVLEGSTE